MTDFVKEIEHSSNCPHCGTHSNDGYVNCFDCGEIFTTNPIDLIRGEINILEAGVDYAPAQELNTIVNDLSPKFSNDNVGVMTWNGGVVVFDGSKPESILDRYKSNTKMLKLASEGDRWTDTLNEFRLLKTDLSALNVDESDRVQKNFIRLKKEFKLSTDAEIFFGKPKFSNFVDLADNKPYGGLRSLTDTIKEVRSCIQK